MEELKNHPEFKSLEAYGKQLIGRTAQSTLLTQISQNGQNKVMEPPMKILSYEIVEVCGEPTLMVELDTDFNGVQSVYEETLRNIK